MSHFAIFSLYLPPPSPLCHTPRSDKLWRWLYHLQKIKFTWWILVVCMILVAINVKNCQIIRHLLRKKPGKAFKKLTKNEKNHVHKFLEWLTSLSFSIPLPTCHTLSSFCWTPSSLPRVTYFLHGPYVLVSVCWSYNYRLITSHLPKERKI